MPQANKKRGQRTSGKKRKLEDGDEDGGSAPMEGIKRRKSSITGDEQDFIPMDVHDDSLDGAYPGSERPFFGLLDEEEQEYFKSVDDMLGTNAYDDPEERKLFVSSVYRELDGKELKVAQSQSCSRLLDRLIKSSTSAQLKALFQKFSGNFIHLISHRFASHCCEALFLRAAPTVTEELKGPDTEPHTNGATQPNATDDLVSMETLFLSALDELEGNVGYLLTDRYASHVLRVLLLILSGDPIETSSTRHLLHSKRKEVNAVPATDPVNIQALDQSRSVPDSFSHAVEKLIVDGVIGLDTDKLRALATHPCGNPTLQLLLKLELAHFGKSRAKDETSIIRTLLPDEPITADSGSATFISGLVYDPVGSHLVEKIMEHAPGKMFKSLYSEYFKERLASHARNEIAGHVVCRILERLGRDDLLEAHELLIPRVSDLLRKGRTMVVRTLIERCTVRDIDTQAIAVQVDATWHGPEGFEIQKLLKFGKDAAAENNTPHDSGQSSVTEAATTFFSRSTESLKAHFNILAQAMLIVPGSLSALVLDSLVSLDPQTLLKMAQDHIVSRTLQAALTTKNASMITSRKLIQHFYGHMGEMALDSAASHVVDCIWEGTHGLAFIRERIAEELAENEPQLRESFCGRAVWKNWKMDLYKRRRGDWVRQSKIKASNDGFQSFAELDQNKDNGVTAKTPLQLARERHAQTQSKNKEKKGRSRGSGTAGRSNASATSATPLAAATAATALT